jgi:hypothetical protein
MSLPLVVIVVSHFLTKLPIQRDDLPGHEGVDRILIAPYAVEVFDFIEQAIDQSQHRRSWFRPCRP